MVTMTYFFDIGKKRTCGGVELELEFPNGSPNYETKVRVYFYTVIFIL